MDGRPNLHLYNVILDVQITWFGPKSLYAVCYQTDCSVSRCHTVTLIVSRNLSLQALSISPVCSGVRQDLMQQINKLKLQNSNSHQYGWRNLSVGPQICLADLGEGQWGERRENTRNLPQSSVGGGTFCHYYTVVLYTTHYTVVLYTTQWTVSTATQYTAQYPVYSTDGDNTMEAIQCTLFSLHNPWLLIELRNPQTLTMWNPDSLFVCLPPQLNCAIDWKIWCMVSYPIKVWRDLLHLKSNYISYKRV